MSSQPSMIDLKTKFHMHGDGTMTVERTQDCTAIAERTKALHNGGHHGTSEMKHAASIPFVIVEDYCNKNGITFHECISNKDHMRRMLSDPDLSAFRVWKGKV